MTKNAKTVEPERSAPAGPFEAQLSPLPTIRGKDEAVRVCGEKFGVVVRLHKVKVDTDARRLASHLIGGACYYSERDLYRWLCGMRRPAIGEVSA